MTFDPSSHDTFVGVSKIFISMVTISDLYQLFQNKITAVNVVSMTSNVYISPIKCSVKYKPPLLAIIYKDLKTGKTRRRTIPLRGFMQVHDVKVYGDKLLRNPKHCSYVSKLPRQQLDSLLQKVKDAHSGHTHSTNHTPTPSPTHASLLGIPSLTTPTQSHEADKLNQEFDNALAELLGPEENENILDVTIPADTSSLTKPISHNNSSNLPSLTNPLSKLPPLDKLPPLKPPDLNQEIGDLSVTPELPIRESPAEDGDISDQHYSADFNSESERSASVQPPVMEDKSLSFAIEELEEDEGSLSLNIEGEIFDDNLLGNSSGEDFRAMDIVTPPLQAESHLSTPQAIINGDEDLNKADDDYLAQRKAEMETVFEANQLKPGDEGYVYDKEMAFEGQKIESGWDSEDTYSDF